MRACSVVTRALALASNMRSDGKTHPSALVSLCGLHTQNHTYSISPEPEGAHFPLAAAAYSGLFRWGPSLVMPEERFLQGARSGKRKLAKHNSCPQEVLVKEYLCISGGWARKPLHLDVVEIQGTNMVGIHATSTWLGQILQGFCRYQSLGSLLRAASQDLQAEIPKSCKDSEAAQLSRANELRAGLWDEEEDEDCGDNKQESPQKPGVDRSCFRVPTAVCLRGHSATVAWRRNTFYVAATSESLQGLVEILRTYTKEEVACKIPEKSKDRDCVANQAEDFQGAVAWQFSTKTWAIRYVDNDGKKGARTKGLTVPDKGFDGSVLNGDEYKKVRSEVRAKAVALWNELDCSDRPRLQA